MLTLEKFEEASEIVKRVTNPTKLIYSEYLSEQAGGKVYLKPENMQHTGAYKLRGAYYKISTMTEEERARGLITASAGNHAQGVAYAAKAFGCKATIVMPTITPLIKVNRTKSYGAEVVLHGDVYDDACAYAYELAEKHGYTFVHPFDDLDVATGQGTIAMEIVQELPTVDYILVPIGGGGTGDRRVHFGKNAEPKDQGDRRGAGGGSQHDRGSLRGGCLSGQCRYDCRRYRSEAGRRKIFPYVQENVDEILQVEDDELIGAFLDMVENHKMIVENSGLLSVAALKQLDCKGKKVVCVLSGGNMDVITMSSIVQHGLIQRDRIFSVSVLLPDKPGELVRVAATIADAQGNVIKLEHNQFAQHEPECGCGTAYHDGGIRNRA